MTKFTAQDLSLLGRLRLDRLRQLYSKSLGRCFLKLDNETLVVHCPEPWLVDQLMDNLDRFTKAIWIIVGVKYVSICYAGEEVYLAKTCSIGRQCLSR